MSEHEPLAHSPDCIWLGPECQIDERYWSEDDVGCCDDCGLPTVKYLKATPEREAAPEMLAALKETVLQLEYLADKFGETGTGAAVLSRVEAVIAKAEGRAVGS